MARGHKCGLHKVNFTTMLMICETNTLMARQQPLDFIGCHLLKRFSNYWYANELILFPTHAHFVQTLILLNTRIVPPFPAPYNNDEKADYATVQNKIAQIIFLRPHFLLSLFFFLRGSFIFFLFISIVVFLFLLQYIFIYFCVLFRFEGD